MAVSLSIDFKLKNIKVAGFWTNAKANTKTFANSNRKIGVSCDCGRSHRALPTVPPLLPLTNVGQVSCFDCCFQYFHIPILVVSIAAPIFHMSPIFPVPNVGEVSCFHCCSLLIAGFLLLVNILHEILDVTKKTFFTKCSSKQTATWREHVAKQAGGERSRNSLHPGRASQSSHARRGGHRGVFS